MKDCGVCAMFFEADNVASYQWFIYQPFCFW